MDSSFVVFLVAIELVAVVVLPWVGARSAFRKHRKGMGIAIIVTALLGVGWILSIIALLQTPRMVETDIQAACPKCGGTRGDAHKALVDAKTQESTISATGAILCGILAFLLVGGALLMEVAMWMNMEWLPFLLSSIPVLSLGRLGLYCVQPVISYTQATRIPGIKYRCSQCKHTWVVAANAGLLKAEEAVQ